MFAPTTVYLWNDDTYTYLVAIWLTKKNHFSRNSTTQKRVELGTGMLVLQDISTSAKLPFMYNSRSLFFYNLWSNLVIQIPLLFYEIISFTLEYRVCYLFLCFFTWFIWIVPSSSVIFFIHNFISIPRFFIYLALDHSKFAFSLENDVL